MADMGSHIKPDKTGLETYYQHSFLAHDFSILVFWGKVYYVSHILIINNCK